MVIKKIVASVMAVATLAMAFAGCGKKESNKFVVGFDQEFPPMGFVADDEDVDPVREDDLFALNVSVIRKLYLAALHGRPPFLPVKNPKA